MNVADSLRLKLTPEEKEKLRERPTDNVEAYEYYLRAREAQAHHSKLHYEQAMEYSEKAIALDPLFAEAFITLSTAYVSYYREFSRNHVWLDRAEQSTKKAEQINGTTATTHWSRGMIYMLRGQYDEAERSLQLSKISDPHFDAALSGLGSLYLTQGKFLESVESYTAALKVQVSDLTYYSLLVALWNLGDKTALQETALKAIPVIQKQSERYPDNHNIAINLAYTYLWAGDRDRSLQIAEQLTQAEGIGGLGLMNLASLYDDLGYTDKCIVLLRRAIDKGYRHIEQIANFKLNDSSFQLELEKVIGELREVIEREAKEQQ
jgi:tetratricopeptide (TPR) repeat protein